jgi:hypothetical protein
VGFVEGETGYCSETCVTCDGGTGEVIIFEESIDIKEEVSIKVEEPLDIKVEVPEAIKFPPMKTEPQVRFCDVCLCIALLYMYRFCDVCLCIALL